MRRRLIALAYSAVIDRCCVDAPGGALLFAGVRQVHGTAATLASVSKSEQTVTTTSRSIAAPSGTWKVDPIHSNVGFAVKHMGIATVRGGFTEFEGTLELGEDLSSAKAYGTVKVESVDTSEPDRDQHLRSPDFFDVAQYPELRFESTSIEALDEETFRITGSLTIRGVTNEIVLHAAVQGTDVDPWGNERLGLEVTGQLSRRDYGMKFNQALGSGNMVVGDTVSLALDISAVKQP
jgi:polyisoprenoid-binding protein YceI